VFICNFTPNPRGHYKIGVPRSGTYDELLNTDSDRYGGSGVAAAPGGWTIAHPYETHGRPFTIEITLPPLAVVCLKRRRPPRVEPPLREEEAPLPLEASLLAGT
jgi:1,4-alpha-glucan branching enzyme